MEISNIVSSHEDRKNDRLQSDSGNSRGTVRRSEGVGAWIPGAVLMIVLVNAAGGKELRSLLTVAEVEPEAYGVRAVESCPRLGYFLEWARPGSQGVCLLCVCKDEDSALCWRRDPLRCQLAGLPTMDRSKRVRRSSILSSLLKPTIMDRNEKRYRSERCKPYEGSYSEGCPPEDWCVGCTVCDCNAEGRWDCHLLSFCGDKNKKQKELLRKIKPKHKVNPSYMKEFVKAAKRQTTRKPKVEKRKPTLIATSKKPANKPTPQSKVKPKPKRSVKHPPQNTQESYGYNDSALAQEVVKRVMAAIQEMTHRKYGLRPDMRRFLAMSSTTPKLKFKKITKKPSPPKPRKIARYTPPKWKTKPAPKVKPQKQTNKPTHKPAVKPTSKPTLKQSTKMQVIKPVQRTTTKPTITKRRPHEKMLEDEIQKIITKAASKIHKQRVKRKVREFDSAAIQINERVPSLTMTTIIDKNSTQPKFPATKAMYDAKDYYWPSGNAQDNYYEHFTLEDRDYHHRGTENNYYKYTIGILSEDITNIKVNADENVTPNTTTKAITKEDVQKYHDEKHIRNGNSSIEMTNFYSLPSNNKTKIPKVTETYLRMGSNSNKDKSLVKNEKTSLHTYNETQSVRINKNDIGKSTNNIFKNTQNNSDVQLLKDGNSTNEIKTFNLHVKIMEQKGDPKTASSAIKKYTLTTNNIKENKSVVIPKNLDVTTTEAMTSKVKVTKKTFDTSIKIIDASNYDYALGGFRPTNIPHIATKVFDKRFDTSSSIGYKINVFERTKKFNNSNESANKLYGTRSKIHNNTENGKNSNITVFHNPLNDLGLHLPVTKNNNTKLSESTILRKKNFKRLFHYIFSKTKEERKKLRKNLLEKEKNNKLEIINTLCQSFGPCSMTDTKKLLMKPLLKELSTETNKIFKTIKIIKGLLHLLDLPHDKDNNKISETEKIDLDKSKLNSIVKGTYEKKKSEQLTETEMTQIGCIKNNTDIFIDAIENFASVMNKLIKSLTSDIKASNEQRRTRADKDSEKEKVQGVFKRIKSILNEHDMAENSLIKALYYNLTKKDRNDVLHLIYRNSDTMDNYKYRLLEILGKLRGVLNRIEIIKAERRYREMLEAEKRAEERKKADKMKETELKNKLEKAAKKKQLLDKKRKEIEGIPIWNMGRPDRRRKRQMVDDGIYEYLLMIMEFLLKQTAFSYTAPPVNDGIELLLTAIQKAPDIVPMQRSQLTSYHIPNKTKELKEFMQQLDFVSSKRQNDVDADVIRPAERKTNLDDVDIKKYVIEKTHNVKSAADVEDDGTEDDAYEHRYERQLNVTELKKANEKLVRFTAEDPNKSNIEKVMEKTVYKRVSLVGKNESDNTDYMNKNNINKANNSVITNIESNSREKTFTSTTAKPTTVAEKPPLTLKEIGNSELLNRNMKSSHKIRHHGDGDFQNQSKDKLVWVTDMTEENNVLVDNAPDTTSTTTTTFTPTPETPIIEMPTTSVPVTLRSTAIPKGVSRNRKRNTTTASPELILRRKEIELLHSLDYVTSDRYPPASTEETDEEY